MAGGNSLRTPLNREETCPDRARRLWSPRSKSPGAGVWARTAGPWRFPQAAGVRRILLPEVLGLRGSRPPRRPGGARGRRGAGSRAGDSAGGPSPRARVRERGRRRAGAAAGLERRARRGLVRSAPRRPSRGPGTPGRAAAALTPPPRSPCAALARRGKGRREPGAGGACNRPPCARVCSARLPARLSGGDPGCRAVGRPRRPLQAGW